MKKANNARHELDLKLQEDDEKTRTTIRMSGRARFMASRIARRHGMSMSDVYEAALSIASKHEAELIAALNVVRRTHSEKRGKRRALVKGLDAMSPFQLAMIEQLIGAGANVEAKGHVKQAGDGDPEKRDMGQPVKAE